MKEILGNDLLTFFAVMTIRNHDYENGLMCTYKGRRYEVYTVSDELFNVMCDMTEEEFVELAGEDAWWRYAEGSVLGVPDKKIYVNGQEMLGWGKPWENEDEEPEIYASNLSNYLCDSIGASQPRNVCALAVDLAKYNNMTMGELFEKYEG